MFVWILLPMMRICVKLLIFLLGRLNRIPHPQPFSRHWSNPAHTPSLPPQAGAGFHPLRRKRPLLVGAGRGAVRRSPHPVSPPRRLRTILPRGRDGFEDNQMIDLREIREGKANCNEVVPLALQGNTWYFGG